MSFVFLNGLERIGTDLKRICADSKMKYGVLDCSFEMLELGGAVGVGVGGALKVFIRSPLL